MSSKTQLLVLLMFANFFMSLPLFSGTNQWPRPSGETPSSPNYENSLHSLVSPLRSSVFLWINHMTCAHFRWVTHEGMSLHYREIPVWQMFFWGKWGSRDNQTEQYLSLGACHLSSTLWAEARMTVGGMGWVKQACVVGGGSSCLLHHFSRIPSLLHNPNWAPNFTQTHHLMHLLRICTLCCKVKYTFTCKPLVTRRHKCFSKWKQYEKLLYENKNWKRF